MSSVYRLDRTPSPSEFSLDDDINLNLPFFADPRYQLPDDYEPAPPAPPSPRTPSPSSPAPAPTTPPFVPSSPVPIEVDVPSPKPPARSEPPLPRVPRSQPQPLLRRLLEDAQSFEPKLQEARETYRRFHLAEQRKQDNRRKTIRINEGTTIVYRRQFGTGNVVFTLVARRVNQFTANLAIKFYLRIRTTKFTRRRPPT